MPPDIIGAVRSKFIEQMRSGSRATKADVSR
jgi:hypothetical protein